MSAQCQSLKILHWNLKNPTLVYPKLGLFVSIWLSYIDVLYIKIWKFGYDWSDCFCSRYDTFRRGNSENGKVVWGSPTILHAILIHGLMVAFFAQIPFIILVDFGFNLIITTKSAQIGQPVCQKALVLFQFERPSYDLEHLSLMLSIFITRPCN